MRADEILKELEGMGSDSTKRMLMKNHGVREPCFGVKIGDMKAIVKRVKVDHQLALDLYATGNYDAMYLAGLIADDAKMTKRDLQSWASKAYGGSLPGSTVAAVTAGGRYGWEMGLKWIDAKKPMVAATGWATLAGLVATREDADLDLGGVKKLMARVQDEIGSAPDAVRYQMNHFIIAVGCYIEPLKKLAIKAGEKIGKVEADLGSNSCKIPFAPDYIRKVEDRGSIGRKRKTLKC
ncbi:MAG: DNA alkylation repair protein [Verrucomicrobiales bacterium]